MATGKAGIVLQSLHTVLNATDYNICSADRVSLLYYRHCQCTHSLNSECIFQYWRWARQASISMHDLDVQRAQRTLLFTTDAFDAFAVVAHQRNIQFGGVRKHFASPKRANPHRHGKVLCIRNYSVID